MFQAIKKVLTVKNFKNPSSKNDSNRVIIGDMNSAEFKEWIELGSSGELNEATYFTCMKMLSEAVGKLPIKMYQETNNGILKQNGTRILKTLSLRPNPYTSSTIFWSTVEMNRNHHGNAYVWIRRDATGEIDSLWIMQSEYVEILIDNIGLFGTQGALWYQYNDPTTGLLYQFHSDEVLHFKTSTTFDGITGASVRFKLRSMIEGANASQDFLTNLYKEGLTARSVLTYTADLDEPTKKRLLEGMNKFATGAENAGKIIPIPLGMTLTPLNIKLADAQFAELRKLNSRAIAAAFGVKPNQLNDYENSNYSNSEMQQLSFYVDTLLYIVKQYEEEMTAKLLSEDQVNNGFHFKFDIAALLRADNETQAKVLAMYVNNGIMEINEAREKNGLEANGHGDKLIVNGNYVPLEKVGEQYGIIQGTQEE